MSPKKPKIRFKKKDEQTKLPVKGSLTAACFDVFAHSVKIERPNKMIIGLGFSTEIPTGYRGVIAPRSSLSKTDWILGNSIGIIDSDYRGEWMVVFKCLGEMIYQPLPYGVGERCAQIYFEPVQGFYMEEVDELSDTERGEGGFGSTGK
jgi:dUTP pyrophosphatase|tara:strand:- start:1563 stop:2009 length:447 start_codon:yes stop_codon:yes gene_type:complete